MRRATGSNSGSMIKVPPLGDHALCAVMLCFRVELRYDVSRLRLKLRQAAAHVNPRAENIRKPTVTRRYER